MRLFKCFIAFVSICFIFGSFGQLSSANDEVNSLLGGLSVRRLIEGVADVREKVLSAKKACAIILKKAKWEQRAQINLNIASADADELKTLSDALTAFWPNEATFGPRGFLELAHYERSARKVFEAKLEDIFKLVQKQDGGYCQYWYEGAGVYSYACSKAYIVTHESVSSMDSELMSILNSLMTREVLVMLVPSEKNIGVVIKSLSHSFRDESNADKNFIIQKIKETSFPDGGKGYRLEIKKLEGVR